MGKLVHPHLGRIKMQPQARFRFAGVLDAGLRREGGGDFLGRHFGDGGCQHRHAEFMRHFP